MNPNISFHPTMTSLSSLDLSLKEEEIINTESYKQSKVLLFKGIPENVKELEILNICHTFGIVKDILVIRHKKYAFVQFETIDQAIYCYHSFFKYPPAIRGFPLYVFYTGKDTINRSEAHSSAPSRYLIMAFGKDDPDYSLNQISQLLKPFGKCLQIFPIQTKPLQVFIEMDDVAQAILVKETLDGKIVFGSIFLTITYSKIKEQFHGINKNVKSEQNLPSSTNILLNKKFPVHSMPELLPIPKKQIFPNPFDKAFSLINTSILEETKSLSSEHQSQTVSSLFSSLSDINEEKSNKILMVKNLPKNVTARMLFRLFGMYGNVQKIKIFYKNRENALVEYQDQFQANLAKVSLNNCPLFGNNIFVTNAKQGAFIDTGSLKKEEENQYMGDYTASTEHRYKFAGSKNYFNIAPPSKVIHISNLCADKEENFYRELFKHCGKIKKFMFLKGGSKMALIEMENIGDAVSILVQFHNYNINGKFLKISFSKYSKIKESQ